MECIECGPRPDSPAYLTQLQTDHALFQHQILTATGDYSIATGIGTIACGKFSTAIGFSTKADADFSTAMGDGTEASG